MECRFCQKAFTKGEHLRRHERSHTGARPFVCKDCRRPFSRQDALARHEKLHTRKEPVQYTSLSSLTIKPVIIDTPPAGNATIIQTLTNVDNGATNHGWAEQHCAAGKNMLDILPSAELDLNLIWPDSEILYQTIMSSDTASQWQMPLGTLPFLPGTHQPSNNANFESISSFDDRSSSIGVIPSGGSHRAVYDVSKMVATLSSSVTAAVEATSITSVFLDECLHMFFVHFIPTFPILHRATFVFRDYTQPLLLNAIAIGSLYLGPKDSIAKGEALWRLAHIAVATSWETLITHRGPYDACKGVQLVVTALLGQVYGALSKNKNIRITSQAFHALGFFWARHCGMFDSETYSLNNLPSMNASDAEIDHQWKVWAAREIQQRALLGHHMLDGLVARMCGRPTTVRHVANRLSLPSAEAAFEAGTAHEWLSCLRSQTPRQSSFRSIFRNLFLVSGETLSVDCTYSAFSLRVILEGLQSLVSDCDSDDVPTVGVPTKSEVRTALGQVHECITNNAHLSSAERLEILLRWHTICLDACIDSSLLCRNVCSRYGIVQHVWGGGQEMESGIDLIKWASTKDARRALLHAIAIQEAVEQLPRGRAHVIHMPSSLFAAATVYSVFSLAGLTQVNIPNIVNWRDVLSRDDDPCVILAELSNTTLSSETKRYIRGEYPSAFSMPGATRNLLYELNSMQKLFNCLSSQWGISFDMENVVDKWIALCH